MAQVNFQLDGHLLETVKRLAKSSGMTMSEVMRRALQVLPTGVDGAVTVGDIVAEKLEKETAAEKASAAALKDLQDRLESQDAALQAAVKAFSDLTRRLGGEVSADSARALERLEKMSEWATTVEQRLKEQMKIDLPGLFEHVADLESRLSAIEDLANG